MNRNTRFIGMGVLVATCALAIAAVDAVNLKFGRKEGDVAKYKMSMEMTMGNSKATVSADIEDKITKADTKGYAIESKQSNIKVDFDGMSMTPPEVTETTQYKPNGEVVSIESSQPNPEALRLANMQNFVFPDNPVKVGDEWTVTYNSDTALGIVAAKATFKLEAVEKVGSHDTAKVKVIYKETAGENPASSDGYWWMDTKTGEMVKVKAEFKDVPTPMPGVLGFGNVTVEMAD